MFKVSYICAVFACCVMAQLPGTGLPGGSVGQNLEPDIYYLKGIDVQVDDTTAADEKFVQMRFNFSKKPRNYFNYWLKKPRRFVLDFYDTKIEDDGISVLMEPPFTTFGIEGLKIDVNLDVEGLEADIRDIARITLNSNYEIVYKMTDEINSIVLSYYWSDNPSKQKEYLAQKKGKWWLWTLLGLGTVGGGTAAFIYTRPTGGDDDNGGNGDPTNLPEPPDHGPPPQ